MSYTNIEQSKKLLKLGLSLESADMIFDGVGYVKSPNTLPCWSIGALLEVLDFLSPHPKEYLNA